MFRSAKRLLYSTEENLVRDATADADADPNEEILFAIAEYTKDEDSYQKIYNMIIKRMTDYPKIKHVHKALKLVDFGLTNFCEKFVEDITGQTTVIQRITKYRYYKNGETDIAAPVRNTAHSILDKLSQEEQLTEQRNLHANDVHEINPEVLENPGNLDPDLEANDVPAPGSQAAVAFDDFAAGGVTVNGRYGSNSGRINGIYSPREQEVGGKASFVREGNMDDPICLWFWEQMGLWMISRETLIGTEQAYACIKHDADHPGDIPDNVAWKVFDKEVANYVDDHQVTCNHQ